MFLSSVALLLDLLLWSQKQTTVNPGTWLDAAPKELGLSAPTISGGVGVSGFISEAPGSFKLLEISSLCIASAQAPCFSASRKETLWNCILPVRDAFRLSNNSLISLFSSLLQGVSILFILYSQTSVSLHLCILSSEGPSSGLASGVE